jgi:hypothetical protein
MALEAAQMELEEELEEPLALSEELAEELEEEKSSVPGGTAAITVWTAKRGRVYEKKQQPPFTLEVPKMRACGEKARPLISRAFELAVAETGYRILVLWVPEDPFTGQVYYLVPLKMKLRKRKTTCVRVFRDIDDAIAYAMKPPRGSEPA